ncbi:2'-5' RNA ligase family protein [Pseudarthrobacter sp. NKDBFgelt]|uniref:2'-5' RNA ligase family protein n=1 Tax=Pseudarthrobacter sp. NKDBFgelt TaxID=3384443 RepID=UPI0038D4D2A7
MRNFVLVAFVEPVAEGQVFPRTQWPLHMTLLRFDVDDAVAEQVAALAGPPADKALGAALTVGEDAGFGRNGSVPVSLVQPQQDLQALHEQLATAVESAGGRILTPAHTGSGYRPHISHLHGRRLRPGDTLVLDRVALVDMAPDGDRTVRRILQLWSLPETGAARR